MSWIARRLRLGKWRYFQGYDLEGNRYFQMPNRQASDPLDPRSMKRIVEYAQEKPMWAYQGNELAVQWSSWLRRTRFEPPSMDELQEDRIRQMRLQENVKRLKEEYAEEKERQRISQSFSETALPGSSSQQQPEQQQEPRSADQPKEAPNPLAAQDKAGEQAKANTRKLEEAYAKQQTQQVEESAVKESIKEQEQPQETPNAERPGAQALKKNPLANKLRENPDASWQPQSAQPKVARRR